MGVNVGTTRVKNLLFDLDGLIVGKADQSRTPVRLEDGRRAGADGA